MSQVALSRPEENQTQSVNAYEGEGRYLYCIVECGGPHDLQYTGVTGIDGNSVYMIPYNDVCAAVHPCKCKPYESDNDESVKSWVLQHQEVADTFCQRFDAVLPTAFDTIIKGKDSNVKEWLSNNYPSIKRKLDKVRGKQEFGIQIFWDSKSIAEEIVRGSAEIKKVIDGMQSKPRGAAYMYKQRFKTLLKKELESRAGEYFRSFYDTIRMHVNDVQVEKIPAGNEDSQMIMNLSCLVSKDKVKELGAALDHIACTPNLSIRFTGPWPAYSFMT